MKETNSYILVFCGLLLGVVVGVALSSRSQASMATPEKVAVTRKIEALKPVVSEVDGFRLVPATLDFATMLEGEAARKTITLERPGGGELRIGRMYTSCKCLRLSAEKMVVPKGEQAKIHLDLHTLSVSDAKVKRITYFVEIMSPKKMTLSGRMTVKVKRVPAKLLVTPSTIQLGTIVGKKKATAALKNLTHTPMQILSCSVGVDGIEVTKKPLQVLPGQSAQVELSIDGDKLKPGSLRAGLIVKTSFAEHAAVKIPINGIKPKQISREHDE